MFDQDLYDLLAELQSRLAKKIKSVGRVEHSFYRQDAWLREHVTKIKCNNLVYDLDLDLDQRPKYEQKSVRKHYQRKNPLKNENRRFEMKKIKICPLITGWGRSGDMLPLILQFFPFQCSSLKPSPRFLSIFGFWGPELVPGHKSKYIIVFLFPPILFIFTQNMKLFKQKKILKNKQSFANFLKLFSRIFLMTTQFNLTQTLQDVSQ